MTRDADVLVRLQPDLRSELKTPLGPVHTDPAAVLADSGAPVVSVGDIVTYHLIEAGARPDVALVDWRTQRSAVEDRIADAITGFDERVEVANPAGTLTADLVSALAAALEDAVAGRSTVVVVDGEEDLAALPAVVAAPAGASVVYGQPEEGMVLVTVDEGTTRAAADLLARMEGDTDRLWAALGVEPPR